MSLQNTYKADRIIPIPMLKTTKQVIGNIKETKCIPKLTSSRKAKIKKTHKVNRKFMAADTFFVNKKIYFGTLIFVNMLELFIKEFIPPFVASR